MITIIHLITILGLIAIPLLKTIKKEPAKPVYKRPYTDDACYAVNDQGYLEEIPGKVSREFID